MFTVITRTKKKNTSNRIISHKGYGSNVEKSKGSLNIENQRSCFHFLFAFGFCVLCSRVHFLPAHESRDSHDDKARKRERERASKRAKQREVFRFYISIGS